MFIIKLTHTTSLYSGYVIEYTSQQNQCLHIPDKLPSILEFDPSERRKKKVMKWEEKKLNQVDTLLRIST